jgi:hypothetical protein
MIKLQRRTSSVCNRKCVINLLYKLGEPNNTVLKRLFSRIMILIYTHKTSLRRQKTKSRHATHNTHKEMVRMKRKTGSQIIKNRMCCPVYFGFRGL